MSVDRLLSLIGTLPGTKEICLHERIIEGETPKTVARTEAVDGQIGKTLGERLRFSRLVRKHLWADAGLVVYQYLNSKIPVINSKGKLQWSREARMYGVMLYEAQWMTDTLSDMEYLYGGSKWANSVVFAEF